MKKLILYSLLILTTGLLAGCGASSSGFGEFTVATNEEVAAVESSLLLDRVLAAETIQVQSPNLLPSAIQPSTNIRYRNRWYKVQSDGDILGLSRGSGNCIALISSDSLVIGSEKAKIEKLDTGAFLIKRGNGTIIQTPPPNANGDITSFEANGIDWKIEFGNSSSNILAILTNLRSGMILTVTELDDGSLTVVRDNLQVFAGRWAEDGSLLLSDSQGQKRRYRYGQGF